MRFVKLIDSINEFVQRVFSPVVLVIMGVAFYEVFRRYVMRNPTIWAWEINSQLMAFMGALAGGYTLLRKGHVSVDIVTSRLSHRTRAVIDIITFPLFVIVTCALVWYGAKDAMIAFVTHKKVISQFNSYLWPIKTVIPIGAALVFLQGAAKLIRDIRIVQGKGGD